MRIKVFVVLLFGLASATASAGGQYSGPIKPYYWYGGLYLDVLGGTQMSNRPACVSPSALCTRLPWVVNEARETVATFAMFVHELRINFHK
jgi:hypothetical protein